MDEQTVTIYRLGQPPIEAHPNEIIWTDRSRIEDGLCPRKRYIRYHAGGLGYVGNSRAEDLIIGGATHEGLDLLIQGGSLEKALKVTEDYYLSAPDWTENYLPEQQQTLTNDGLHLSKAFVYAFNSMYLPQILQSYDVIEVEEEINWLLHEIEEPVDRKKYIVVMSRTDGVIRNKETGRLWNLSHKTAQEFGDVAVRKLDVDIQRFSESLAVWAKYGEVPEGTFYNYFLKGRRWKDENMGVDRFLSGLIRPWINRRGMVGDINPELLSFSYEWTELDGHFLKKKRLGAGWERCSIYDEMDYFTYLQWLEEKLIPRKKDYLLESVVGLIPCYFNEQHALRWRDGTAISEHEWKLKVDVVGLGEVTDFPMMDKEIPLISSQCYSWNKQCSYHPICWKGIQISSLVENGSLEVRSPNHAQESGGIT